MVRSSLDSKNECGSVHVPMTIVVVGACLGCVLGVETAEAKVAPSVRLPLLSW